MIKFVSLFLFYTTQQNYRAEEYRECGDEVLCCDAIRGEARKTLKWAKNGQILEILLPICYHFSKNGNLVAQSVVKFNVSDC